MVKVAEPGIPEDYRSLASYQKAVRNYKAYIGAKRVWRQIGGEERLWILQQRGYKEPEKALARDTAGGQDLSELVKLRVRDLYFIRDYPKSGHRQAIYKARLAASPRSKDVRVRKHEKRLRLAGLRRPR